MAERFHEFFKGLSEDEIIDIITKDWKDIDRVRSTDMTFKIFKAAFDVDMDAIFYTQPFTNEMADYAIETKPSSITNMLDEFRTIERWERAIAKDGTLFRDFFRYSNKEKFEPKKATLKMWVSFFRQAGPTEQAGTLRAFKREGTIEDLDYLQIIMFFSSILNEKRFLNYFEGFDVWKTAMAISKIPEHIRWGILREFNKINSDSSYNKLNNKTKALVALYKD